MDTRILAVSDHGLIPSSYVRVINTFEHAGFDYDFLPAQKATMSLFNDFDIIVFQRCFSGHSLQKMYSAQLKGKATIYELDDYLLDLPEQSNCRLLPVQKKFIRRFLRDAHAVTCSTPALAARLTDATHAEVIPNRVLPRPAPDTTQRSHRILLSNTDYFKLTDSKAALFEALHAILNRYAGAQLLLLGSATADYHQLRAVHGDRVEIIDSFFPYNEYMEALRHYDIDFALVPLEHNELHVFKSNIKYLDYAALSIPGIYSRTTAYADSIRDGENGLLVDNTAQAWFSAMQTLLDDDDRRQAMARSAWQDVASNFHLDASVQEWTALFARLLSEHRKPDVRALARLIGRVQIDRFVETRGIYASLSQLTADDASRFKHELDAANIRVHDCSNDRHYLSHLLRELEADFTSMLQSSRWKLGNALVGALNTLRGRKDQRSAVDTMRKHFSDFKMFEKRFKP